MNEIVSNFIAQTKNDISLGELINVFLRAPTGHSLQRKQALRALFYNHVPADMLKRVAQEVTSADIEYFLDAARNKHQPAFALTAQKNRLIDALQQLFLWAARHGYIAYSPIASMSALKIREFARERVLDPSEIRQFWQWLDNRDASNRSVRIALQLELLLGRRASEITQAEKSWVSLERLILLLPATVTKNRKAARIPLPPLAVKLFAEAIEYAKDSLYCFPARYKKSGQTAAKAMDPDTSYKCLRSYLNESGALAFTQHDLRRTAATYMDEMDVAPDSTSAVLSHARNGITRKHYVVGEIGQIGRMRVALQVWEARLKQIIA
jgi:integrase